MKVPKNKEELQELFFLKEAEEKTLNEIWKDEIQLWEKKKKYADA